jgi:hypothetical protein
MALTGELELVGEWSVNSGLWHVGRSCFVTTEVTESTEVKR